LLTRKEDRSWRQMLEKETEDWWKVLEARAMNDADPINPQRVFSELSSRLPDNCIISADSGTSANWLARDLKIHRGMMASLSGNLATMCPAVPYAIAAKFCFPSRVAIALVGDGAMQMLGNNGLITIAKYWQQWSDPRLIVLVLNNRDLNQVTWEQRAMAGDPKFEASQDVPDFAYARYAELLRLRGIRVDKPRRLVLPGMPRSPPIVPSCSKPTPIQTCRRSRRTSRSSKLLRTRRHFSKAIPKNSVFSGRLSKL
jgi:pyruvate dehydrogenase (quinone)